MAKQTKKPAAKAAKQAKKPAAKKTTVKKPAVKQAAGKKAAGKSAQPKASGAAGKKPAGKSAKKPAAVKTSKAAKKPAGRGAKKPVKGAAAVALLDAGAPGLEAFGSPPSITSPANGATVPANTDLPVTIATTEPTEPHELELVDTATGIVVYSVTIAPPGTSPFTHTIPARKLSPSKSYQIRVRAVGTPGDGTANITTGP